MRVVAVGLISLLAGCELVFPVHGGSATPDGGPPCVDMSGQDEDGDGVRDDCDLCPGVADPSQSNVGELDHDEPPDLIGDACDPHPTRGGDVILSFAPFNAGADGWAGWAEVAGALLSVPGTPDLRATLVVEGPVTIEAGLDAVVITDPMYEVKVVVDSDDGHGCLIAEELDNTDPTSSEVLVRLPGTSLASFTIEPAFDVGRSLTLQATRDPEADAPQVSCRVIGRPERANAPSVVTENLTGQLVITATGIQIGLRHVVVYGVEP